MARWKANSDGSAYWDEQDSGPNQVAPPPGASPTGGTTQPTQQASQPYSNQWSQAGETNFGQTLSRFQNDYLAPDRDQVLDQMGQYQQNQQSPWTGGYTGKGIDPRTSQPGGAGGGSTGQFPGQASPTQSQGSSNWYDRRGATPAGFDQNKWNSAEHNTPKYIAGRIIASGGSAQDVANALGGQLIGKDKMTYTNPETGNQEQVDFIQDEEGAHKPYWGLETVNGQPAGGATASLLGGGAGLTSLFGSGGTGGISGGSLGGSLSLSGTPWNEKADSLYGTLMGRAGQSLNVSRQDPVIANQVNSYRAEQERGARNQIDALAEAKGPYSNLNSERRLINERAAQSTGNLQSQLMGQELSARRQEIAQALQLGAGMLSDQQRMELQRELSYLDAALQNKGLNQNQDQFLRDLGLRAEDRASYWDWTRSGGQG